VSLRSPDTIAHRVAADEDIAGARAAGRDDLASRADVDRELNDEAARSGIDRPESAGVVKEITKRKWGRAWECVSLLALLDGFDQRLARSAASRRMRA